MISGVFKNNGSIKEIDGIETWDFLRTLVETHTVKTKCIINNP
jgi:hypothetical protein